jgi:hypothetical protein
MLVHVGPYALPTNEISDYAGRGRSHTEAPELTPKPGRNSTQA